MKGTNKSFVIDGVNEVDDLTLVSHFAQTEFDKIQELNNFKRGHSSTSPSTDKRLSQFTNAGDESDGSDSDVDGLNDVLTPLISQSQGQVYSDQRDPLDNLSIIDTVDLPEKVLEDLPISKIGRCKSVFEDILIIESLGDSKVLDLGSIVCRMDRTILGTVSDTFGPTSCPYYMVILRNKAVKVDVEEYVYCDVNHSTYVTDQNFYSHTPVNEDESDHEKMEESQEKTHHKLKQSYKDL